jgi:prophage antirepressor-like protein
MNEIVEFFEKEGMQIEVLVRDGKEYFPAKEVAEALGYANTRDAILTNCRKEGVVFGDVGVVTGKKADGSDAIQNVKKKYIDEGNLFRLIVKSQLPGAAKFESWVFDEVLPAIRKKGSYSLTESREKINAMIEMRVEEKLAGFIEVIEKTMGEIEEEERVERNEFFDKIMEGAKEGFEKKREYIFMPMEEFQKMVLRHDDEIAELKKEIIEMKKDEKRLESIRGGEATKKKMMELQTELRTTKKMCSDILNLNKKYKGEK